MLSCKEPGGLFATCELGNGALCAPFPGRARALPREKVACQRQDGGVVKLGDATEGAVERSETEGVALLLHAAPDNGSSTFLRKILSLPRKDS